MKIKFLVTFLIFLVSFPSVGLFKFCNYALNKNIPKLSTIGMILVRLDC